MHFFQGVSIVRIGGQDDNCRGSVWIIFHSKPTDNPVNEALNGWIKEELTMDFGMDRVWGWSNIVAKLDEYITFYNEQRPCFAIGYETPDNYRKRYYKGELPRKNSFESRELSTEPKFVKERRKKADNEEDT